MSGEVLQILQKCVGRDIAGEIMAYYAANEMREYLAAHKAKSAGLIEVITNFREYVEILSRPSDSWKQGTCPGCVDCSIDERSILDVEFFQQMEKLILHKKMDHNEQESELNRLEAAMYEYQRSGKDILHIKVALLLSFMRTCKVLDEMPRDSFRCGGDASAPKFYKGWY